MHLLRLAEPRDADAIAGIYAPYVRETTISFEHEPPSVAQMSARMAGVAAFYPWLVLELDARIGAYAYATRLRGRPAYDWVAETSVYVDRELHGQGHGATIYRALLELLALQGVVWAYGGVTLPNPGSQRFHAKLGFERVGCFPEVGHKFGRWCDLEWWRIRVGASDDPAPIRALREVDPAALAAALGH